MTELAADAFHTVGPGDEVPDNYVTPYYLAESKSRIAVARADGRLYAFDDICSCAEEGCPLSGGLLEGTTIMCQCHGSRWDITSGAVVNGPATDALKTYEIREADNGIQVRVR